MAYPRTLEGSCTRGKSAFSSDEPPQYGPVLRDALGVLSLVRAPHETSR